MAKNRVRELRKLKGMTVAQLADMVGQSQPNLTRVENGRTRLTVDLAKRIAMALGVSTEEVLGLTGGGQAISADATAFQPQPSDMISFIIKNQPNIKAFLAETDLLDRAGIHSGDIALADTSEDAILGISPLQIVVAQVFRDKDVSKSGVVLRQFVPPSLLITNSSSASTTPLDTERDDVRVVGAVVAVHKPMQK